MKTLVNWIFTSVITGLIIFHPDSGFSQSNPTQILLKNYKPVSIFKVPVSTIEKSKFPVIDMHTHVYAKTPDEVEEWVKMMDEVGIEKSIVLTQSYGQKFDSIKAIYSKYPDRFELWCGLDYSGYDQPGFGPNAVAQLEKCFQAGAKGVGELGDKGKGLFYCRPQAFGMHMDDPRLDPVWEKCAELGMPVNVHVAEPEWFYEPMDSTNDGLMNAYKWRLDNQEGILNLEQMVKTLENAVARHPRTTFIACHLANCNHDLKMLGNLFDKYPNLFADISARFAENAPIPRYTANFFDKYKKRILYGTDMRFNKHMYQTTFRILESADEHFYETDLFGYHWPLYGLDLNDRTLKRIYGENAKQISNVMSTL